MASTSFLRMLFGQGTEPTYAGLRMPRQRVEDDAMLIRQGNPQERYRDYHAELPPLTETEKVAIQGAPMEAPNSRTDNAEAKNQKIKGAIKGVGAMFVDAIAQQQAPQSPLQFAQLQQQQLTPLIDPRFMRYGGGRKRGGTVEEDEFVNVHEGELVVNPKKGKVKVIPADEVSTIASMLGTKVLPREPEAIPSFEQFQASRKAEQPVNMGEDVQATETVSPNSVTETVTEEPSIADVLRQKMEVRQKRLAEGATKNPDGTTMYGGKQYRKRNAFDALKSAGLGVLQSLATAQVNPNDPNPLSSMLGRAIGGAGAGAVMGATMNNVDERMMDKMKLAQLAPQYEQAYGMERQKKSDDTAQLNAESLRKDREADNIRNIAELRRKIEKDAATTAYWNRKADQGDLKIANDVELMVLRDKWAASKDARDTRRLDLVEKEMGLRTDRNNANIASREKIAGMGDAQKTADRKEKVKQWVATQKLTKVALQNQIDERIKAGTLTLEAGKQMMADAFDQ